LIKVVLTRTGKLPILRRSGVSGAEPARRAIAQEGTAAVMRAVAPSDRHDRLEEPELRSKCRRWPRCRFRRWSCLLATVLAAGCAESNQGSGAASSGTSYKSPADRLAQHEIELLVAVASAHEQGLIPEFSVPADEEPLDAERSARELEAEFQIRFQRLFDPARQGDVWARSPSWAKVLQGNRADPSEFAAIVRNVGCAIMRARLESRVNLARLLENARAEVEDNVALMEAIEAIPPPERTRQDNFLRTRAAVQLGRAVALRSFAELVAAVPQENVALVKQHGNALRPLLPRGETEVLLEELRALGKLDRSAIERASHQAR
jgi:hypothetical protein